jgi:NADH-quinone oxidoreductase subunit G
LSNAVSVNIDTQRATLEPCVAPIYQLDGLVRRASSLQLTADARAGVAA